MANKIFYKGLKNAYTSIETKNENSFYFCTDTRELYVGEDLYTEAVRPFTGAFPTNPATSVLYLNETTGAMYRHNGTAWVTVVKPAVTVIDISASDDTVPTTKAVKDYVDDIISDVTGGDLIVTGIASKENTNGTLEITKADGSTVDAPLTGVAHDPMYDSENLKLTLPVVGGTDIVVNIPKDNFVKTGSHYDPETKNLVLKMKQGEDVLIPAADLVDVYTSGSGANDTITINVGSDNKISASFKVDTSGVLGLNTDGTLTIDISDYVTFGELDDIIGEIGEVTVKKYVDDSINTAVTSASDTLDGKLSAIEDKLTWGSF